MKIRNDFVSNSSSSSFIIFGSKVRLGGPDDANDRFDVSFFSELEEGEGFFIILRNRGSEGDYIIMLTPELLMDCDMHQLDLTKVMIVKGRYCVLEGGSLHKAADFKEWDIDDFAAWHADHEKDSRDFRKRLKDEGVSMDGLRAFSFNKDYGNPKDRETILEEIENAIRYDHHDDGKEDDVVA